MVGGTDHRRYHPPQKLKLKKVLSFLSVSVKNSLKNEKIYIFSVFRLKLLAVSLNVYDHSTVQQFYVE